MHCCRTTRLATAAIALCAALVQPSIALPATRAASTPPLLSGADWMGAIAPLLGPLPLNRIVMPGTHDSASYSIPPLGSPAPKPAGSLSPEVFDPNDPLSPLVALVPQPLVQYVSVPWARAQDLSIAAQLAAGVRYLDLRVCAGPGANPELYACHSLYGAAIRTAVLRPVASFAAAHPGELVILDFHRFAAPRSPAGMAPALHQKLAAEIHAALGSRLVPPTPLGAAITFATVLHTSGRVIVLYNDSPTVLENPDFWPYGNMIIAWPATDSLTTLEQHVAANLTCRCDVTHQVAPATDAFFDLQLQRTPSRATYIQGTFGSSRMRSLRDLASANPSVLANLTQLTPPASASRANLNIISMDFEQIPGLLSFTEAYDRLSRAGTAAP
jgi:hypothetical protein